MADDKAKTAPVQAQLTALGQQLDAIVEHLATVPRIGRPPKFGECVKGHAPGGCTEGTLYGYQMGCHGDRCRAANSEYYNDWRQKDPSTPQVKDAGAEVAAKAAARTKAKPKVNGDAPKPAEPAPTKRVATKRVVGPATKKIAAKRVAPKA